MGRRLTWLLRGSTAALLILLVIVVIEFVVTRDTTPPITGTDNEVVAGSIASLETIELGGVSQAVLIRGHDRTKPVLLFLHGGPGMPAMYLAHAFQRNLEEDFVVVHWDRRGAGKSYRTRGLEHEMTVRRLLEDTYELTRILSRRWVGSTSTPIGSRGPLLAPHGDGGITETARRAGRIMAAEATSPPRRRMVRPAQYTTATGSEQVSVPAMQAT